QWTQDQSHVVTEFYLNNVDLTWRRIRREMAPLDQQLDHLSAGGGLTLVSWEKSSVPYAHVLTRGVYTARTERVEANTPHFLPPLPANEPRNRLALAKWTISPENPLTARVTVNRMWYELFGTGLVETTEDFGIMGQRPTHPELLDWLAVEFRDSGLRPRSARHQGGRVQRSAWLLHRFRCEHLRFRLEPHRPGHETRQAQI